ncbi:hypothetical protein FOA43_004322 [Brettanomyces nanus]|uniref:Uncharacterized protein n=1 Tax=Eeniella nana TaxID=13502 RepID=A0A875S7K0_EENNA|nr:uncharacterized protein FOA43_004322 [Brettanomyces nanus]QPG76928.1 hypothetical protein FOA43_004322 [Brettanomyces nanus]
MLSNKTSEIRVMKPDTRREEGVTQRISDKFSSVSDTAIDPKSLEQRLKGVISNDRGAEMESQPRTASTNAEDYTETSMNTSMPEDREYDLGNYTYGSGGITESTQAGATRGTEANGANGATGATGAYEAYEDAPLESLEYKENVSAGNVGGEKHNSEKGVLSTIAAYLGGGQGETKETEKNDGAMDEDKDMVMEDVPWYRANRNESQTEAFGIPDKLPVEGREKRTRNEMDTRDTGTIDTRDKGAMDTRDKGTMDTRDKSTVDTRATGIIDSRATGGTLNMTNEGTTRGTRNTGTRNTGTRDTRDKGTRGTTTAVPTIPNIHSRTISDKSIDSENPATTKTNRSRKHQLQEKKSRTETENGSRSKKKGFKGIFGLGKNTTTNDDDTLQRGTIYEEVHSDSLEQTQPHLQFSFERSARKSEQRGEQLQTFDRGNSLLTEEQNQLARSSARAALSQRR